MPRDHSRGCLLVVLLAVIVTACATQPVPSAYEPPGFLLALFHGAIAPFALVAGVFTETRIYAFPNSGLFYDLGFLIGLGAFWGGGTTYVTRS